MDHEGSLLARHCGRKGVFVLLPCSSRNRPPLLSFEAHHRPPVDRSAPCNPLGSNYPVRLDSHVTELHNPDATELHIIAKNMTVR
jgi:hypothetical protein